MKKEYQIEQIEWNDAYHLTDSWSSLEQIAEKYKQGAFKVCNIGWIIFEDKKYIIMSSKRDVQWGDYGFVMFIPKVLITKRTKV